MKRDLVISFVETNTGLIRRETRKAIHFDFRLQKDSRELHSFLDEFLRILRDSSPDTSLCLDIMADLPFLEGRLPFVE